MATAHRRQGVPLRCAAPPLILVIDDSLSVYASVRRAISLDGYIHVERLDCFIDLPRKIRDETLLPVIDLPRVVDDNV